MDIPGIPDRARRFLRLNLERHSRRLWQAQGVRCRKVTVSGFGQSTRRGARRSPPFQSRRFVPLSIAGIEGKRGVPRTHRNRYCRRQPPPPTTLPTPKRVSKSVSRRRRKRRSLTNGPRQTRGSQWRPRRYYRKLPLQRPADSRREGWGARATATVRGPGVWPEVRIWPEVMRSHDRRPEVCPAIPVLMPRQQAHQRAAAEFTVRCCPARGASVSN